MEVTQETHARFSEAPARRFTTRQKDDNDSVAAAAKPMAVGNAPREVTQAQGERRKLREKDVSPNQPKKNQLF